MDSFSPFLLKAGLLIYLAGAGCGLLFIKQKRAALTSFVFPAVGALFVFSACLRTLLLPAPASADSIQLLPSLVPNVHFDLRLDPLGAFFGIVVSLLALALSVYSVGYASGFFGRKNVGAMAALFNVLVLAITLVFLAANAFFFLIVWEIMALSAFCLVSYEHEREETRKAGVLYFIMSHFGTGFLILGFLLLFQKTGTYEFSGFHAAGGQLSASEKNLAFLLFLVGFGIKAGIVPLHIWLPAAHPVAPSNVSALMSGIMIKTGIYGIARVCFDFLGTPPNWWGATLLTLGTISAVLGVLYALMEHDLKRLLAYHSVENIGIILMGFGASLMFLHSNHPALAALSLIAGLYHTINHAVFKALLFMGAGAVVHGAHTRDMEKMGGLAKRMGWTAFFFLMGAVAISALPPLNGFVSEWLTYQSLLQGYQPTPGLIRLILPLGGAMLALTGALAAACFVKAFGITFLAQPRSDGARQAHEAPVTMLVGQGILVAACFFLGLFPTVFLKILDPVTQQFTGESLSASLSNAGGWSLSGVNPDGGTVSTLGITLTALCLLPIPLVLWFVLGRKTRTRIGPTWDCGLRGLTPNMEYTATGFSKPIRMVFKALFRPRREVQREYDFSPYFATNLRFESHVEEIFQTRIYRPLNRLVLRISRRLRALQAGSIQAYLIYIFVTLLLLLIFAL